jgi:hypothetical protein
VELIEDGDDVDRLLLFAGLPGLADDFISDPVDAEGCEIFSRFYDTDQFGSAVGAFTWSDRATGRVAENRTEYYPSYTVPEYVLNIGPQANKGVCSKP